jgi:hypothetical protein
MLLKEQNEVFESSRALKIDLSPSQSYSQPTYGDNLSVTPNLDTISCAKLNRVPFPKGSPLYAPECWKTQVSSSSLR